MRAFNALKIGALALVMVLMLSMMAGCANNAAADQNEQESNAIKSEELIHIEQEWDAVIRNEDNYVKRIDLAWRKDQSILGGVQHVKAIHMEDQEDIDMILEIVSIESAIKLLPQDQELYNEHKASRKGKDRITIAAYGDQDQRITYLAVFEDDVCVMYEPGWYGESEAWIDSCIVTFSEPIYKILKEIYDSYQ